MDADVDLLMAALFYRLNPPAPAVLEAIRRPLRFRDAMKEAAQCEDSSELAHLLRLIEQNDQFR